MKRRRLEPHVLILSLAVGLLFSGCAMNPATGERQLVLFSEAQEIEMGRQADQGIQRQYGVYDDDELTEYVQDLGTELARTSERPDLPWTFRVLDDPVVNAFALPGGYIYITRGILAHLASEAELAGVIGHEIGHVTGRHGVERMSQAQLAGLGLGLGQVLSPEFEKLSGLAEQGLGLLFLKYGRDQERQADDLGVRYMSRGDYPPAALVDVFGVLGRVSEARGGGGLPGWLSTHPAPENRQERITDRLAGLPPEVRNAARRDAPYLRQIDGIVYGQNPRQGFFEGGRFIHPELAFELDFPTGWQTQNQRSAVLAASPERDAILVLSLAEQETVAAAEEAFFQPDEIAGGGDWLERGAGLIERSRRFSATLGERTLEGAVAFAEHDGRVFRLLGYAPEDRWTGRNDDIAKTVRSFRRLRDRELLNVKPRRIELVELRESMTLEEFAERYPSTVTLEDLSLLNRVEPGERLPAGAQVKRVVGFRRAE